MRDGEREIRTQVERQIDIVARRAHARPDARLFMRERIQFISRTQTCVRAERATRAHARGENVIVPVRRTRKSMWEKTDCQVAGGRRPNNTVKILACARSSSAPLLLVCLTMRHN